LKGENDKMATTLYFLFYFLALFLHFLDSEYCGVVLKFALAIPIIDFIIVFIGDRKLTWFNFFGGTNFVAIGIVNIYLFTYHSLRILPYLYLWIVISFVITIFINWKGYINELYRVIVYSFLMLLTLFNASMSPIQRLDFYTIGNPFYSDQIDINRLHNFAYLYYENGDLNNTFFLLNRCKTLIREDLSENPSEKEKRKLKAEYREVENSITRVMQHDWKRDKNMF